MSDQHAAGSLPELTPEQEEEVRRLLAEARHDEPIPAAVADRLDAALADLTRDQPAAPGVAPVIDLAARRRRRNAAALLTGAAAVIVAGFAIGQAIGTDNPAGGGSNSTAANADRGAAAGDQQNPDLTSGSAAPTPPSPGPLEAVPTTPLTLRSAHLRRDVEAQLQGIRSPSGQVPQYSSAQADGLVACATPTPRSKFGLGDLFPALFDGRPAVLALRPPSGGTQRADVLACDTGQPLDGVNLSLP